MLRSVKTKLITGMALLLIVAFGLAATLLIRQKTVELSADLFRSVKSFSDLASPQIVELYERYLSEDSFVFFNREIQQLFDKTQEVVGIGIAEYDGTILYDSSEEAARQYSGERQVISDVSVLARVQAAYPSYLLASGRVVYLQTDEEGVVNTLDENQNVVDSIDPLDRLLDVIYPYGGRYALLFAPSYQGLDARIQSMWRNILLLTAFALLVGMAYAYFFSTGLTRPLKTLQTGAIQLGQGDFKVRVTVKSRDEVGVLATTFNKMAEDLERSVEARLYKERLSKELELASEIQQDLLPKTVPSIAGLDLAAGLIPATEVGGDVYDFLSIDEDNHFGYVGDVTGHGVPAGLLVSVTNALIHSYAHLADPLKILFEANTILKKKTRANMFVTLVLWHWNSKTEQLKIVSAGHEVALKYNAHPVRTEELQKGGIALGMLPDIKTLLKEQVISLQSGDCVVLYTDGVPECWRNDSEQYGMPNFKRVVTQSCDLPTAEAIKVALLADVVQWSNGYTQKDDITVMVLKRR